MLCARLGVWSLYNILTLRLPVYEPYGKARRGCLCAGFVGAPRVATRGQPRGLPLRLWKERGSARECRSGLRSLPGRASGVQKRHNVIPEGRDS